jgi:hypothetical protein
MNKITTTVAATFIMSMCFIYLLVAFMTWDINAGNWEIGARIMYVLFATICSAVIAITKHEMMINKK